MKVACERCGEVAMAELSVVGERTVEVTCGACGGRFQVTTVAPTAPRVEATGDLACPKCGHAQSEGAACRRCGLAVDRMASYVDTSQELPSPPVLDAWRALEGDWNDRARHDRMVEVVAIHDAYGWAARRYRDALRSHGQGPLAREYLNKLGRMAQARLAASATPRLEGEGKPFRGTMVVIAMLGLLVIGALAYAGFAARPAGRPGPPSLRQPPRPAGEAPTR